MEQELVGNGLWRLPGQQRSDVHPVEDPVSRDLDPRGREEGWEEVHLGGGHGHFTASRDVIRLHGGGGNTDPPHPAHPDPCTLGEYRGQR